ncbi:MAG: mycocerosate synthase [Gemmataceae bacterium]|nr:mycocerosate synthase [Gemmataceae bacterium]
MDSQLIGPGESHVPERDHTPPSNDPIAIIGIGCRLPGHANTPAAFWKNLLDGVDAITEVPADRWSTAAFYDPEPGKPGKSHARWGGFVDAIDQFDPHFFGISPREAARMDPQQRMLLEVAWEAVEDAGQPLGQLAGHRVGVFVGISSWDYSVLQTSFRDRAAIDTYTNTGGSLSIAANRISYCFDFRGPSVSVDTACSSALVAVHLACRSIWVDGCPLALAGGVNALLTPDWFIGFSRLGMLSPDGRCKAFDARGNGFVRAEGAGVVVLKPLARAVADGDRVYAVIRGTAVNQDGRTPGMTVPGRDAQEELLRLACRNAGVSPEQIQYVEAHGTGTPVGDPIEAAALGRVLADGRAADRPCVLGSVKTHIGHLEAGSGIAGLIKTALALYHRRIPGNLHFERQNPDIAFERLRLRVPVEAEPWPTGEGPRLAGINSFGFGGTNAHAILEGAPPTPLTADERPGEPSSVLVPLSARSPEALSAAADALGRFGADSPADISLADIAWNAAVRRTHHDHRLAVVARSKNGLAKSLTAVAAGQTTPEARAGRAVPGQTPRVAFICSGQGPQWWAMGRQLLEREPVFRDAIERCDAIVRRLGPWSLLAELTADESRSRMAITAISQPAIFAVQVGLAAVWRSWGVRPETAVGHSVGEVAAAHLAGVFTLEDAVRVIFHRGRCMELAPSRGRMLAAGVTPEDALRLAAPHGDRVALAAVNAPASVTLSGESDPLEEIARELERRGVFCRFLRVNYAFHSAQMDPIRRDLIRSLAGIAPRPTTIPLVSTVTGRRIAGPEMGPDYWWQNVRRTVRFADSVDHLVETGCDTVVELSPHPVLAPSVAECYQQRAKTVTALPSLRREEDERATMLGSLGVLHAHGYPVDWSGVMSGPRPFVRLPGYPWQRQRCWAESEESRRTRFAGPAHPLLGTPVGGPQPAWEARLDTKLTPYLADHRVQKAVILPATAYAEAAFAVARDVHGTTACILSDAGLSNPCFLGADGAVRLHTAFHPDDGTIRIDSRPVDADDPDWSPHFRASLRPGPPDGQAAAFDRGTVQGRCPRVFGRAECYEYFAKLGLEYGPRFRGIRECWVGGQEALGVVEIPDELAGEAEQYLFHPALLDACFHVVIPADPDFNTVVGGLYLPVAFEEIHLYRRPGRRVWSHARLREKSARHLVADVAVYDEEGELVVRVRGLRSQRVAGTGVDEALDDLLYAYEWQPRPLAAADSSTGDPGAWLIFADRGGVGDRLAEQLRAGGAAVALVYPGTAFDRAGNGSYQIDPASADDMHQLVRDLRQPVRGIVQLWALDAPAAEYLRVEDLASAQRTTLLGTTHLVQAWERVGGEAPRLVLVTRNAQPVGDRPGRVEVAQAPLIGLGRVIANECAILRTRLIDLDPEPDADDVAALLGELRTADDEDEIAWRGGKRFAHRFVPTTGTGPVDEETRPDEAYRLSTRQPGSLDRLILRGVDRRPPARGHVEIEVCAAGLNFSDVMKALGIYPGLPDGPIPFGAECSGRITVVGEGVGGWAVGDEVFGVAPFAFASHATTRAEFVARKPTHLRFEEAAAIPIAFLTAAYALDHLAHLAPGERVLIHSAAGGVGLAAVQLARRTGAEVFATAGTPQKREYLSGLGIPHVMDSRTLAFADEVLERTAGRGVDVVLNSLAGAAITRGLDCLAEYGRFLEIGKRDIYGNSRVGLKPFRKNLSFLAIDLDRVMRERPAVLGSLLGRLAAEFRDGQLTPPPCRTFPVADVAAAFRHMQAGKHIGKVVVSMTERPPGVEPGDDPPTFRKDASYLIAGGLGGFGLAVARWMAEGGAGHLVLVGRRGAGSAEARRAVAELEGLGTRVTVLPADITSEADLGRVLGEIDRTLPPLRGVVHAAMVLEDCLLRNLDRDRMDRVLAPKVQGAWNLHTQTTGRPLDFFVLFSSLSSVFGHAGQGNYAAANAFLDALAWHRRARGLPALAVNWGHIGQVGYLAERQELGDRLERQGVMSIPVRDALTLLGRAIRRRAVQVSVMRVEWSRWRGLGVTGRASPRFAHLLRQAGGGDGRNPAGGTATLDAVLAAPADARVGALEAHLRDRIARVLGIPADRLDADTPLLQLGIDSLMAVELLNWIAAELRVTVPAVDLMRSPGLSDLTGLLLGRLGTGDQPPLADEGAAADGPAVFPLSHGQRGFWLLHQMDRTSPALNLSFCSRIRSPLDPDVFRRAIQGLVDRHPSLRTTFEERDGEPFQRVHDRAEVSFDRVDAAAWGEGDLRARLWEEAARPFDLERGPLVRMLLFSRSPDDHVFLLTAHHIVGDFWSLVLLLGEMSANVPPARAATGYQDFVRWQAALLNGPAGDQLWRWWRNQLDGAPPVLDLPTDRPRPPRFTYRGGAVPCQLDADLSRRLKQLAAAEGVTLYTVLLAGFQALLGRYAGREEFIVGSAFAGRSRREFEGVVGYFVNMLPLRADLTGDPTVRELLRRVSDTVLGAFEHQDFPFPLLVERLNPPRDPSRTPLVQVSFTLQKSHRAAEAGASRFFLPRGDFRLAIGGMQTEPYPIEQRTCQADLEMVLEDVGGTIEGMLCYNTDLYDPETMDRLIGHFRTLLDAVTADPNARVAGLPWLTAEEREDVLTRWNQTGTGDPPDICLHELVERQAAATPDAVAIRFQDRTVRYGELERWANRIAHGLRRQGVGPGQLVGLCMERSPELVAAALGTLKAGAAYVPLDSDAPADRLRTILGETRVSIVLSHGRVCRRLPRGAVRAVCVDSGEFGSDGETATPPLPRSARPGDLAYVIFTSGSTGRPNGVMVEHAAICNTVLWRLRDLPQRPDDRALLTLPAFFDASLTVIFPTLASGGQLVLAPPGEELDPALLLDRVARDGVTVLQCLPGVLGVLVDTPGFEAACRTVRRIVCGGESMPADLPGRLHEPVGAELFNLYGPTEAAVEATWWPCRPAETGPTVPIGRPVANVRAYVLDPHRRPVPVGVPGELYLGGAGLARGYLNDPVLTAERFVADPFDPRPGARLFRSGDRCRWRAGGVLEILGRLDRQVKVRGYRIEPGEVEAALAGEPGVREAVVTLRPGAAEQQLVAYVVGRSNGEHPSPERLRRRLGEKLPRYMVPASVVLLEELPRTSSGKVDTRSLSAPGVERVPDAASSGELRTPLEEFLAGLWRERLGIDRIGVGDHFFEMGGSSLGAVQIIGRVREKLGRDVHLAALLDAPTVAGFVRHLCESHPDAVSRAFGAGSLPGPAPGANGTTRHTNGKPNAPAPDRRELLVELQKRGFRPPLFLVHPPGGIVVCYQALARHLGRDRPVYGIRARGVYGDETLPATLEEMAAEYVAAIRTVQPAGPYFVGGWSLGGVAAFEVARQLLATGEPVGQLVLLDTTLPFADVNEQYLGGIDRTGREYGFDMTLDELAALGPDDQLPFLWEHVRKLGLIEEDAPPALVRQMLDDLKRLFHAHVKLTTEYAVRPYPGRITLFRPNDSPVAAAGPADRGWGRVAAEVEVRFVPGQHHSMVKAPHVRTLARQLRRALRRTEYRQAGSHDTA